MYKLRGYYYLYNKTHLQPLTKLGREDWKNWYKSWLMKKESREKSMIAFIRVFGSVASSNSELLLLLLEDPWCPLEYLLLSFLVVLFASAYAEIFIYVLFLKDNYLEEARKMRNLHFFTGRFACLSFKKNWVFFNRICFLGYTI